MEEKFESWAVIELFGHQQIAGVVSEAAIGGCALLRVDVPEEGGEPGYTKYYGNGAIYSMTPCTEQIGRAAVRGIRARPIEIYGVNLITAPSGHQHGDWEEE